MKELNSINLSNWILQNSKNLSPLKLQKLLFYCYGVALAFDFDEEIGLLNFEAWKYGPVEPIAYRHFKAYGSSYISMPNIEEGRFSSSLQNKLRTALKIYGNLAPMDLVRQTHLELPWIEAWEKGGVSIKSEVIKNHFHMKFKTSSVAYPEVILDSGFFEIDNIPVQKFRTIEDLAASLS